MKHSQNGFIGDFTFAGWVVIIFAIFVIGVVVMGVYGITDASAEQLKEVNATVELAQQQPFAKEFNKEIKPYLEDGRITKQEAETILKQYETIKLKYSASK